MRRTLLIALALLLAPAITLVVTVIDSRDANATFHQTTRETHFAGTNDEIETRMTTSYTGWTSSEIDIDFGYLFYDAIGANCRNVWAAHVQDGNGGADPSLTAGDDLIPSVCGGDTDTLTLEFTGGPHTMGSNGHVHSHYVIGAPDKDAGWDSFFDDDTTTITDFQIP